MSKTPTRLRPFGMRDKTGYMLGNIANDFTFIFASLYLRVFYTDVLGINAALVGTMFLYTEMADGTKVANASAFPIVALVTAVLAVGCYFMCTERVKVSEESKSVSFKDTMKALAGNRALIGISLVFVCYLGAQMLNQTINNYIFKDYFGDTMGLSVMNAAGFITGVVLPVDGGFSAYSGV